MLLNLNRSLDADLDLLEGGVKAGCNAVHLTIHWDMVYPNASNTADWRKFDRQIELAQKLGAKIAIRILLSRGESRIQGYWEREHCQHDQQGKPLKAGYQSTYFSYAHRPSVNKALGFVKEVCERYNHLQKQGLISWVGVSTTPTQETGYYHENSPDGNSYSTVFDYSTPMQQEFRIWLNRKYKKIARLNAFWQTEYENFEQVVPPKSLKNRDQVFWGQAGIDWYVFKHAIFKQFVEQSTQTIKSINSSYRVVLDFGSVFDHLSNVCGSISFKDLSTSTDGVKINNDVFYDHHFSTDILRSNLRPDQLILNEVFPDTKYPVEALAKQIDENFANGTHWISVVIGTPNTLEHVRPVLQKSITKWLQTPYTPVVPKAFMSYALSRVLEFGYFSGGIYGEWLSRAGGAASRQPVDIKVVEDLLSDTLKGSINQPPVLKNAIPTKTIKVLAPFRYTINSEVFKDPDGIISKIEAFNLPKWLTFSNNTFAGMPPNTGTFRLLIRATDDDGAVVEASFEIVVDAEGRLNAPPTLKNKPSDALGVYKQPFILSIPNDIFDDSDGFISQIEVLGLPSWAKYSKGEIRGIAENVGTFPITLRAVDDENASVQATFRIVVNYPNISLDLIQGGKPGERFLLKRLSQNDVLLSHQLPKSLNVHANCDAIFDAFELTLTGPYLQSARPTTSPFALFNGDNGFPATTGSYLLKANAYFRKELIASVTYPFSITPTDPTTQQPVEISDWSVFPNPTREFVSIKLPTQVQFKNAVITSTNGQWLSTITTPAALTNQFLTLDLRNISPNGGLYMLKINSEDGLEKTVKVIKTP
ncbi:MAG: putative Ig domain-containing protein [Spirosomaceae bacterium]|nr:putative Ig domain-containing protein [Spirosomataceae bacterium]